MRTPRPRRALRSAMIASSLALLTVATACSGSSSSGSSSSRSSILPTTTTAPHASRVRIVGDGRGAAVGAAIATALATTDLVDLSHADASLASLLDLPADPSTPDEGRLHDSLVSAESDAPEIVVLSLGSEVFSERAPMAICSDTMWSTEGVAQFDACVLPELDRLHFDQRVMAIVLDLLAHTESTRVVLLHVPADIEAKGLAPWQRDELVAQVNTRIDRAMALVAEAGATWGDRSLVADPANAVDVARARAWF